MDRMVFSEKEREILLGYSRILKKMVRLAKKESFTKVSMAMKLSVNNLPVSGFKLFEYLFELKN